MNKKRDIYIRIENLGEIVETLKVLKQKEEELKKLFYEYDKLNLEENRIFENWNNYLEDVFQRMDHMTL